MSRLDAKYYDFTKRAKAWTHFWQDGPSAPIVQGSVDCLDARYYNFTKRGLRYTHFWQDCHSRGAVVVPEVPNGIPAYTEISWAGRFSDGERAPFGTKTRNGRYKEFSLD